MNNIYFLIKTDLRFFVKIGIDIYIIKLICRTYSLDQKFGQSKVSGVDDSLSY